MSVKIAPDKGATGFLFGHYHDLMGSEEHIHKRPLGQLGSLQKNSHK